MSPAQRILFLYNADSGRLAALLDSLKKAVRSSRACSLCTITHGWVSKKTGWHDIECRLGIPVEYYHRDEMPEQVREFLRREDLQLPAVLLDTGEAGYRTAVTSSELRICRGEPECLGRLLEEALASLSLQPSPNQPA